MKIKICAEKSFRSLSVTQAAAICNVGRTTVGYWVRSKKLFARRVGRNFTIPVEDLRHFLKSTGQPVPPELGNGSVNEPVFKSFQNCWHYWPEDQNGHRCNTCIAFKRQAEDCFSIRKNGLTGCPIECRQCRYYQDMFVARFQFIHQIDFPACVFKGLSLWGGNAAWTELCGVAEDRLIGLGIEKIFHSSSLASVISAFKRISLGEKRGKLPGSVFLTTPQQEKRLASVWVFPLEEPNDTFLMLAQTDELQPEGDPQGNCGGG
jgi:excisionase family DNA binding protein